MPVRASLQTSQASVGGLRRLALVSWRVALKMHVADSHVWHTRLSKYLRNYISSLLGFGLLNGSL